MWVDPVFDRTQADVDYARANRNDAAQYKGARNYTDMLRITGNIHHIAGRLAEYGYPVAVTCKTDWTLGEVPTRSEIEKIKTDVQMLRDSFAAFVTTPPTPELPYTAFQK